MARQGLIPFDQRSIRDLYRLRQTKMNPYEAPKINTSLAFKLGIPLISPLIVIGIAPFCLIYSRQRHLFLIYAIGLFALFAVYMLLDSLTILSDNGVITPSLAVYVPLALLTTIFSWRFGLKT
jgi:lipopolysaccharide export system permease protein